MHEFTVYVSIIENPTASGRLLEMLGFFQYGYTWEITLDNIVKTNDILEILADLGYKWSMTYETLTESGRMDNINTWREYYGDDD